MPVVLLMLVSSGPPTATPCTIEGQVKLVKAGKELDPSELVVVYVRSTKLKGPTEPRRHTIRQANTTFVPRVLVAMVGDTVEFVNDDKFVHSVYSPTDVDPFELPANAKGKTGEKAFMFTGPYLIQCEVHASMRSDVLVLNNGHFARPDSNGAFKLNDLPAGRYTLVAWEPNGNEVEHEVPRCAGEVNVGVTALQVGPEPARVGKDGKTDPRIYP